MDWSMYAKVFLVGGLLCTLRAYPLVYPGNLIARVLGGASC